MICLGDIVGYGPEPASCVRWLRERDAMAVQGNHDRALGEGVPAGCSPTFQWLADATYFIGEEQLTADEKAYLAKLPDRAFMNRREGRFMLVHATPSDPLYGYRASTVEAWRNDLGEVDADCVLVGHTHLQFELRIGAIRLVNPGSAGQPKDGDPRAAYAVLEKGAIRFGRAEYAVEETITGLRRGGVAAPAADALAQLLRSGRVPAMPNVLR